MAIAYFDSSAFVKLMVEEDGSDLAAAVWDGCDAVVSSRLAHPEVSAALAAACRAHRLTADQLSGVQASWGEYWAATRAIELSAVLADAAAGLAERHALRGADAVHLASFATVGLAGALFVAWDDRLREGARSVGAQLIPPG